MKMPVPWFDLTKNSAGLLTSRLSKDCSIVNTMVTTVISLAFQNLSILLSAIIISLVY